MADYYLCPYPEMYLTESGAYSLTAPGMLIRAARLMAYGTWDQARGTRCTMVKGGGANGWPKTWCLARVQDDQPALGLIDWTALDADASCIHLPVGPTMLDREWGSFSAATQNTITTVLENHRLPADLITPTTTVRQIIRTIIRILFACQQLGADFPELDLTARWGDIPTARRQRIATWAATHAIDTSGLNANSTIRTIIKRLAAGQWGRVTWGGEDFA